MFTQLSSLSSGAIVNHLRSWFNLLGWPQSIRSDGGPQFRGDFVQFCLSNGIKHELSAPYNPRSNGLAESGVKIVKSILIKCLGEGKDIQRALYEWRNAPRAHGFSPAQLMFGRSQNMLLPQPPSAFNPVNFSEAAEAKDKFFHGQEEAYNRNKRDLRELSPDEKVRVQCEKTGLWDKVGAVIEIRPDKLSYLLDVEGKLLIRARFMIRPLEEGGVSDADLVRDQGGAHSDFVPRRSERLKAKTSAQKCVLPMTKSPSCGSSAALNGSTESKWLRTPGTNPRTIKSSRMPGDFPWSMYNGQALPQGPQPLLSSPSSPWLASSASGSGLKLSVGPSIGTPSSCPQSLLPLCPDPRPLVPVGQSLLQKSLPQRLQSGSGPLPVGPVFQRPTCPPQGSCLPSSHFPSSRPLSTTMEWAHRDTRDIQFPRLTSEDERPCSTPVAQRSLPAPDSSSSRMSQSLLSRYNVSGLPGAPRPRLPPRFRLQPPLQHQGPLPGRASRSSSPALIQTEQRTKLSCGQSERPRQRREQPGCIRMNKHEEKLVPAHSVKEYNSTVSNCVPGSVQGMKVFF